MILLKYYTIYDILNLNTKLNFNKQSEIIYLSN